MDKQTIKWQFKGGKHSIFCDPAGSSLDPEVVKAAMGFHFDTNNVMSVLLGCEVDGGPIADPDFEIAIHFYKENGKLTVENKLIVPPKSVQVAPALQAVGLLIYDWMRDHFRVPIEQKAVVMDRSGNLTRKAI